MLFKTRKLHLVSFGALAVMAAGATSALAGSVYEGNGLKADFTFEAGFGTFLTRNANFGSGVDFVPDNSDDDRDIDWQEFYMLPKLSANYDLTASSLYGEWAVAVTGTRGDGDAIGWTSPNTDHVDNEIGFVGWKSGKAFATENLLDIYYGQARFAVSDGFVVGDGSLDKDQRGCFWLAPHVSFQRAAVVKINSSPARGDLFYIDTDWSQENTKGFGANVEYSFEKVGTVGAMFLSLTDSDRDTRDGMKVYEVRYMGNPLASFTESFYFNLEYALERNGSDEGELSADALVTEAGYTFAAPWSPTLSYRFANYSGDEAGTAKSEAYDPLFQKAFGRGWGTWLEGELMGEFFYSNSNKKTHMIGLRAKPTDSISTGILGYSFYADQGNGMSDTHMADEINLYVDWTVSDKLFITGAVGRAIPAKGLKDAGYDENFDVFEVAAIVYL